MAEKRGKSIRLAVVAANDLWDGILRAATALKSSTIVLGHSAKESTEEQARQIGDSWEELGDQKPQFNLEIHLANGDKIYKVLGPHAPNLTGNEVTCCIGSGCVSARSWRLRNCTTTMSSILRGRSSEELDDGREDEVVKRLRAHLDANLTKKSLRQKPRFSLTCRCDKVYFEGVRPVEFVQCPHRLAARGIAIAH